MDGGDIAQLLQERLEKAFGREIPCLGGAQ
jgi:hypothetical protein